MKTTEQHVNCRRCGQANGLYYDSYSQAQSCIYCGEHQDTITGPIESIPFTRVAYLKLGSQQSRWKSPKSMRRV